MARRSAWLSGRTDPLGRSSSSKGDGRELAIVVLLPASRRPALGRAGHAARELAAGWGVRESAGPRGCGRRPAAWREAAGWRCGPAGGRPAGWGRGAQGRGPARVGDVVGGRGGLGLGGGRGAGPRGP